VRPACTDRGTALVRHTLDHSDEDRGETGDVTERADLRRRIPEHRVRNCVWIACLPLEDIAALDQAPMVPACSLYSALDWIELNLVTGAQSPG